MLEFGWACGASWQDRVRLVYYADLKASLVFRGWTRYAPERPLAFSIKITGNTRFQISACDNGWDAGTIALFFSPRSMIVPPDCRRCGRR
jgi:hypothetical protein